MKFGVFDHLDRNPTQSLAQFFENRLTLVEAYDRLGFHALHTAEHHFTPLGMASSPSVYHAAVAQRTKRLRFGPLVYTLNLYHPLRLAEEICMLDHMSGGRLQLGVGRGISPFEVGYFGEDPKLGQEMYIEAFDVLMKALACRAGKDTLSHEGRFYRYRDVPIEIEPLQQPHPPLWYGIGNPDSVPWCVQHRVNVVTNAPAEIARGIIERYRAAWTAAGHPIATQPFVGTTRHIVVAPTDREADEIAARAYLVWYSSFIHLFRKHNATPRFASYADNYADVRKTGLVIAGSPARVLAELRSISDSSSLNYLLCRFAFGDLSIAESMRSVELFAAHVMPALGDL